MDSGGGSVVVAAGSEIVQSTIGQATTQYRKWFRLYSDGWCEQGGLCKDDTKEELPIPYDDLFFQVELTTYASTPPPDTEHPWWQDFDPTYTTYHSFTPRLGPDRTGGPTTWAIYVARGYVSQETFKQVLAGKEWDPVTEGWRGAYLVNIESGSRELTLEPGRYKVYMVGKGGEATGYAGEARGCKSGGSGGTIIATFTLSSTKSANCIIDDTNKCTKLILDNSDIFVCGYGTTSAGGTNTVDASFSEYIDANETGSIDSSANVYTWDHDWGTIYASTVKSYLAEVLGVTNGNSGSAHSNHGGSWAADSLPGEALIRLFKYGD